jgi:hypothetical protein
MDTINLYTNWCVAVHAPSCACQRYIALKCILSEDRPLLGRQTIRLLLIDWQIVNLYVVFHHN